MDDAEAVNCEAFDAEAVLKALGASLNWQTSGSYGQSASAGTGMYGIGEMDFGDRLAASIMRRNVKPVFSRFCVIYRPDNTVAKEHRFYWRIAAAKAACERHYATGRWE